MPKDELKYGYDFDIFKQNTKRHTQPDQDLPPALARPNDLYHLSKQPFAQNENQLKRYFLTAFVSPEDRHLLEPPGETALIKALLETITTLFKKPAHDCDKDTVETLKNLLLSLFKSHQWLGVALSMVDTGVMPIDYLNTIIQWQAAYIQWGESSFHLEHISKSNPLPIPYEQKSPHKGNQQQNPSLHNTLAQKSLITDEMLQNSDFVKKNSEVIEIVRNSRRLPEGPLPIENVISISFSRFKRVDNEAKTVSIYCPSTTMLEHELKQSGSYTLPLYSFGYLAYEEFNSAAFLGARIKQAYLPGAKGNLLWAHDTYQGESLVSMHDDLHLYAAKDEGFKNRSEFENDLRVSAMIANAFARVSYDKNDYLADHMANRIIDLGDTNTLFLTQAFLFEKSAEYLPILRNIYQEFAITQGLSDTKTEVNCTPQGEIKITISSNNPTLQLNYSLPQACISDRTRMMQLFISHVDQMKNAIQAPAVSTTLRYIGKRKVEESNTPHSGKNSGLRQ